MTADEYVASLPDDRRPAIAAIRSTINDHIPAGYTEDVQHGMLSWHTEADPSLGIVALASQKHHMALYLMGVSSSEDDAAWFRDRWTGAGKKLDMGKSCVRFTTLEDVPLDVVAEVAARTPPDELVRRRDAARRR